MSSAASHHPDPAVHACPGRRLIAGLACLAAVGLLMMGGCSPRWNTLYNANQAFKRAEQARDEAIREGRDVAQAVQSQRQNYMQAVEKAQKALDMFPGHSASDEALFLQGKSHHRLASYRMSIRQFDLLFTNFPRTKFMEESLFLQAINYLMINDAARSQTMLDLLERQFPDSRFQADALRASGDNAFALQDWEGAALVLTRYLERYPRAEGWDLGSLQLAEALWELDRCGEVGPVLQRVIDESPLADRVFRARLLLSRCHVRLGDLDAARAVIPTLKSEGEIHGQPGQVGLVEAEILLAAGQRGTAVAMLENMDSADLTSEVKPLWADMLGHAYLAEQDLRIESLEKARDYFQQAVGGAQFLENPDHSQHLLSTIRGYLAAENQLPTAPAERAARLRLQQANALLFTFDRPRMAYDLFTALAADSSADSTVAPRALYGASILAESAFEQPDSAQVFARELLERFPDSPQAYKLRSGAEFDLLAFLLEKEMAAQMAVSQHREGRDPGAGLGPQPHAATGSGLRRRMVYLQRRPNLIFPPPAVALQALADRQRREQAPATPPAPAPQADGVVDAPSESRRFDPLPDGTPPAESIQTDTMATVQTDLDAAEAPEPAGADTAAVVEPPLEQMAVPEEEQQEEPGDDPEPERPRRWDF